MKKRSHIHYNQNVVHDVECMSFEELSSKYGLELQEDNSIWDSAAYRTFETLDLWVKHMKIEEENEALYENSYKNSDRFNGRYFED